MSPWSLCCLRYYWSFYSPSSPLFLIWFWWHSYFLANFLIIISKLCRFYQLYFICNFSPFVKVFYKDQSLDHSYSYSALLLSSVLLSPIRLSAIIYLLMTLNCSSPSGHLNSPPLVYTYKIQLISSLNGCLLIFSRRINLKQSFFLLAYLLNYLKSLILFF